MMPTSRLGLGVRDALSEGAALAQHIPVGATEMGSE